MTVREARDQFGRLIDAAHYAGEITIVSRQGEPWAAIVPLDMAKLDRQVSSDAGGEHLP